MEHEGSASAESQCWGYSFTDSTSFHRIYKYLIRACVLAYFGVLNNHTIIIFSYVNITPS